MPPGDAEALAGAIRGMLEHDSGRRAELGAMAREHVAAIADLRTETAKLSSWITEAATAERA